MFDWALPYTCHWRLFRVDPGTWLDGEPLEGSFAASVVRDCDGDAPTLESGSVSVSIPDGGDPFQNGYYRISLAAEQDGEMERVDVATMLFESSGGTRDRGVSEVDADGMSVLHPASTAKVADGENAPSGCDGVEYAASLLESFVSAPVEPVGSFTLQEAYVFDYDSSVLDAVWKVLRAGGWCIQITGRGVIRLIPEPAKPALVLDRYNARLLMPGTDFERDASGVHNRYRAVDDYESVTVVNDDPGSETSTVRRGYFNDEIDTSPMKVNGETLTEYAARKLASEYISDVREYRREWVPDLLPFDVVRGSVATVGIDADLHVMSQDVEIGAAIVVTEKAEAREYPWKGL